MSTVVPFRLTPEANRQRLRRWLTRSIELVEPARTVTVSGFTILPEAPEDEPQIDLKFYPEIPPLGLRRPPRCACYGVADV